MVELDDGGVFVSIFLEELTLLGETMFATTDLSDKTDQVNSFLEFLLALVQRELGEHIDLDHVSPDFRVGLVLLAQSRKAEMEGVGPYVRAIDLSVKKGCESIYVIAYPAAKRFLGRVLDAVEGDERLTLICKSLVKVESDSLFPEENQIVLLRRNTLYTEGSFSERLEACDIHEGKRIEGTVLDVSKNAAVVDILGINGFVSVGTCLWTTVHDMHAVLRINEVRQFLVDSVETPKRSLRISLKFPEDDPWITDVPVVGDRVHAAMTAMKGDRFLALCDSGIEITIPILEVSWSEPTAMMLTGLTETRQEVIIFEKDEETRRLLGSIRRLEDDPWPSIAKRYSSGTMVSGTVTEVAHEFIRAEIEPGISGVIPRRFLEAAGHEYSRYQETVVVGQGLDLFVVGVHVGKRRLSLNLMRNKP